MNHVLKKMAALTIGSALGLQAPAALGQDSPLPEGFETQPVLSTNVTRDNDPIDWPDGDAKLISVVGTIQPDGRTPLHQHPVPTFVYILEGEVELRTEDGDPQTYRAGEAYVEALNRKHQLFNVGEAPAKLLVVFAAEEGQPTTVASE